LTNFLDPSKFHFFLSEKNSTKPTLVLVHGLHSQHKTFLNCVEELQKDFNCLIYDQRGHGKTPRLGEDYSAHAMAKDLKNLLDHLNLTKIFLLGHSMGGRTAMAFVDLFPEMLEAVIIEDMGCHQRAEFSKELLAENIKKAKDLHRDTNIFNSREEALTYLKGLSLPKGMAEEKIFEIEPGKFETYFYTDSTQMYGYQGNFSDLTLGLKNNSHTPLLFLRADPKVGSAMKETCIEHIKLHLSHAKVIEIKDSWHNIHNSKPEEFYKILKDFFLEPKK